MLNHYRMFSAYNAWANRLVYEAAAALTPEELHADKGAFFGSLFGTLSHILTADRVWMRRFTGEGPQPRALDEKPFDDLASLNEARMAEDRRIIDWTNTLTEDALGCDFTYTPLTSADTIRHPLAPALAHFFNHQTHHRGQAHMTLTALGKPSLSLDLIYYVRREGKEWL